MIDNVDKSVNVLGLVHPVPLVMVLKYNSVVSKWCNVLLKVKHLWLLIKYRLGEKMCCFHLSLEVKCSNHECDTWTHLFFWKKKREIIKVPPFLSVPSQTCIIPTMQAYISVKISPFCNTIRRFFIQPILGWTHSIEPDFLKIALLISLPIKVKDLLKDNLIDIKSDFHRDRQITIGNVKLRPLSTSKQLTF